MCGCAHTLTRATPASGQPVIKASPVFNTCSQTHTHTRWCIPDTFHIFHTRRVTPVLGRGFYLQTETAQRHKHTRTHIKSAIIAAVITLYLPSCLHQRLNPTGWKPSRTTTGTCFTRSCGGKHQLVKARGDEDALKDIMR